MFRLLPLFLLSLAACSGDDDTDTEIDTEAGTEADTSVDTEADTEPDTEAPETCTYTSFVAGVEEFTYLTGYNAVFYTPVTSASHPNDGLNLELYFDIGASTGAHTYSFTSTDTLADCHTCLTIARDCSDVSTCSQQFLAQEGSVTFTSLVAEDGGALAGRFDAVVLHEITVDDQGNSTLVEDGDTWCLDGYTFDGTLE